MAKRVAKERVFMKLETVEELAAAMSRMEVAPHTTLPEIVLYRQARASWI